MTTRVDLHTHSEGSPDGGLHLDDYRWALESGMLQCVAITDHNTIAFAIEAQKLLGERIIVGEEISTKDGEIVGLYLTHDVKAGLTAAEACKTIKRQHGLVYVPHPFETVRSGVTVRTLDDIAPFVDIVEVHNGRAIFQNRGPAAQAWATRHKVAVAASSDAHGRRGWGRTFTTVGTMPTRDTLVELLQSANASRSTKTVGLLGALYPKRNRLRRRLQR